MLEILLGDARDGDIFDVDFVAADEVEEEFERAGVDVELDAVFGA